MSGRPNQWLRRNLHENGLPLPGFEGVYLRPGRLAVLSAGNVEHRTDFLLVAALNALARSRAALLLSRTPVAELIERLTDLRFGDVDEVSEKMQREFWRLRVEYFVAYNRSSLEPEDLNKEIADFISFERRPPSLVLLDVGVMKNQNQCSNTLARMALKTRAAWIMAVKNKARKVASAAPMRLRFQAESANEENGPGPAIYIA